MWFAAKEAVEKKAMERGREQGHQEERERIGRSMKERGMPDDEIAQILEDKPAPAPPPPSRPYRRRFRRGGNGG